jgi:stage IV sporulation protein FB
MVLFQPPSPTRYDLRFSLAGIPVRVHPLFWLMTILFGAGSGGLIQLLIWVAVVFVSILIHEMGHALTMRHYGLGAEVILYLGGGLAVPQTQSFGNRWNSVGITSTHRILISLAGPGAGFLLALLVIIVVIVLGGTVIYAPLFGLIPSVAAFFPRGSNLVNTIVGALLWINIVWGVINLVPTIPLDGGNISYTYLTSVDPLHGERKALRISLIAGIIAAIVGLVLMGSAYMALLFGILAIQSYERLGGGFRRFY